MVGVINDSLEPVNYTKGKVLCNIGQETLYPMNTQPNVAWKVNTQQQCKIYVHLLIR